MFSPNRVSSVGFSLSVKGALGRKRHKPAGVQMNRRAMGRGPEGALLKFVGCPITVIFQALSYKMPLCSLEQNKTT